MTAIVEAGSFTLNAALALTPAQLMFFYEKHLRGLAASRASAVMDMLAAVSAMGGTEFVQQHIESLQAIAAPPPEGDERSYTTSSNTNVIVL